jgi:hypothetical protein
MLDFHSPHYFRLMRAHKRAASPRIKRLPLQILPFAPLFAPRESGYRREPRYASAFAAATPCHAITLTTPGAMFAIRACFAEARCFSGDADRATPMRSRHAAQYLLIRWLSSPRFRQPIIFCRFHFRR